MMRACLKHKHCSCQHPGVRLYCLLHLASISKSAVRDTSNPTASPLIIICCHCCFFWLGSLKCDPLQVLCGNTLGVHWPKRDQWLQRAPSYSRPPEALPLINCLGNRIVGVFVLVAACQGNSLTATQPKHTQPKAITPHPQN